VWREGVEGGRVWRKVDKTGRCVESPWAEQGKEWAKIDEKKGGD
jgi:hypothetical protein